MKTPIRRLLLSVIPCLCLLLILACTETKTEDRQIIKEQKIEHKPVRGEYPGMVYIPAGEFMMSTDSSARSRRRVKLKAFYIDIYEVSNLAYQEFIDDDGYLREALWSKEGWEWRQENKIRYPKWWQSGRYRVGPNYPNYPVGGVSWYEAEAFARWAGKRLPTEAEWEMASRGTDGRYFPWGNEAIQEGRSYRANFEPSQDGNLYSGPIDSYPQGKSPWGCYNMLGNVWEWVHDSALKDRSWHHRLPESNPVFLDDTGYKLLRGGSWFKVASIYDSYFRLALEPGTLQYDDTGFRCARDAN